MRSSVAVSDHRVVASSFLTRTLLLAALGVIGLAVALIGAGSAKAAGPTAVAADSDGVVYAGFANGGTIRRYSGADGSQLSSWGSPGSAPGQLGGVVAIDAAHPDFSTGIWILDTNLRVQEFTRSGNYVRGFTLPACDSGVSPDPLTRGGIDVSDNSIYVAHPCANKTYRYDLGNLSLLAQGTVAKPKGVSSQLYASAPGSTKQTYFARPGASKVEGYDWVDLSYNGVQQLSYKPADVFIDAFGVLTTTDTTNEQIHLYDSSQNEFRTLGRSGSNAGDLNDPLALDVFEQFSDLSGNLFIADYGNKRIQRWNPFGFTFWTAAADDGGGGGAQAPVNTTRPAISGNAVVGNTLTCSDGSWSNGPTGYTYAWSRDGSPIGGATQKTYQLVGADAGKQITCTVTAANGAGSAQATSDSVTPSAEGGAPVNQAAPQISGTATPGNTLSCSTGSWSNNPSSYSYAWNRDGSQIASGSSYTVTGADVGHALTCTVTATNGTGSGSATSNPVTVSDGGGSADGPVGVSIADGDAFTNSPGVTLTIHEPEGATAVLISNDGGFAAAEERAVSSDDTYTWTLSSTGAERLPKTVYVRFQGAGIDGNQTYTDDIVLDETAPVVQQATLLRSSGKAKLKVRAKDRASGVARLQLAKRKTAKRFGDRAYKRKIRIGKPKRARFVRVVDRAGNVGEFKRVKKKRSKRR